MKTCWSPEAQATQVGNQEEIETREKIKKKKPNKQKMKQTNNKTTTIQQI